MSLKTSLKTSKSKEDVKLEKEKIQKLILDRAKGDDFVLLQKETRIIKKLRQHQTKKMLYMDDELTNLWQTYISQQLMNGNKVTFQEVAEKLLKKYLLNNIK